MSEIHCVLPHSVCGLCALVDAWTESTLWCVDNGMCINPCVLTPCSLCPPCVPRWTERTLWYVDNGGGTLGIEVVAYKPW